MMPGSLIFTYLIIIRRVIGKPERSTVSRTYPIDYVIFLLPRVKIILRYNSSIGD